MSIDEYVSKNFEEMSNFGIKGILCFWCRIIVILIPIVNAFFSIYVVAQTASKIWISAISAALLAVSIILFIFSISSATFLILCLIGIKIGKTTNYTFIIATLLSISSLIIEASLLSQITKTKAELMIQDLTDYCIRNYDDQNVRKFLSSHASFYSIRRYVEIRTTDIYGAVATFLALWIIFLVIHYFLLLLLSNPFTQNNNNLNEDVPPSPDQLHDLQPA